MSHARLLPVAVVTLSCALVAATPGATAKPRPIPSGSAFTLPSASHCVSGGKLTLKVKKVRHIHWISATVKVDGRTVRTVRGKKLAKPIRLTGLPRHKFTLQITAKAHGDRQASAHRTYKPCGTTGTPTPTPSPTPTPTPTPTPAPSVAPGSYSGSTSQSRGITFYVSADKSHVQDVSILTTGIGCAPTHSFYDALAVASIPIAADGSFSSTTTQDGVLEGAHAHFTYTFSGRMNGTSATGAFREDITYDNGIAYSCSTNNQTWTAARDTQGSQDASAPPPGSYTGSTSQSRGITFYVANDGSHLQDVDIAVTGVGCAPTKGFYDQLAIASIPVAADGSFASTTTQDGVIGGAPAHFTYTFRGHLHGKSSSGIERAGGQFREDITYNDGTAYSCTTNDQTWAVDRESQGTQSAASPPGSYSGSTSQSRNITFYVSSDSKQVQDVSIGVTGVGCTPSKSFYDELAIAVIPIGSDGSFSSTTTQDGVVGGAPAHFTYTFRGHFHGTTSGGVVRASGQFREDVTYDDGTAYSCTTNDQTWDVLRDQQGAQTAAAPPPGAYGGSTSQSRSVTFHVANSASQMTNVDIPVTGVFCTPSNSFYDQLSIGAITIGNDGSFSSTTSAVGVVSGATAHFTYTFRGHFHGTTSGGVERAAGQFREDVTYDNGTSYSCTTNDQMWSATRTGP